MAPHAGPSAEELNTVLFGPSEMTLPEAITHPSQLYTTLFNIKSDWSDIFTEAPGLSLITNH